MWMWAVVAILGFTAGVVALCFCVVAARADDCIACQRRIVGYLQTHNVTLPL